MVVNILVVPTGEDVAGVRVVPRRYAPPITIPIPNNVSSIFSFLVKFSLFFDVNFYFPETAIKSLA